MTEVCRSDVWRFRCYYAAVTERFYDEVWPHAAVVLRTARFLSGNDTEADDLAQEVMLKAFRRLGQFQPGTDMKAWLLTILRNTRIDRLRARTAEKRDVSLEALAGDPPAAEGGNPLDAWDEPGAVLERFSDQQVIEALNALPEEIRWTLLLVDVEGLDHAEAAKILEVPVGTIKSRAHRGRGMLRGRLAPLAKDLRILR